VFATWWHGLAFAASGRFVLFHARLGSVPRQTSRARVSEQFCRCKVARDVAPHSHVPRPLPTPTDDDETLLKPPVVPSFSSPRVSALDSRTKS
jgi:hypothetical protein